MNRPPAVAGMFYPDNPAQLKRAVNNYLSSAEQSQAKAPKAMIVPHAGYIYSAQAASHAYCLLNNVADTITRVVILGPSHRVPLIGLAVPSYQAFTTPLGDIPVDKAATDALVNAGFANYLNEAHQLEHSIEVQLPFLQTVLKQFSIVSIAVGMCETEEVSQALEAVWGQEETLIIISSDLSHYLSYQEAVALDQKTAHAIECFDLKDINHEQACGATAICGLLASAKRHALAVTRVALCNSGDTAGTKDRVVGYGSFVFNETPSLS